MNWDGLELGEGGAGAVAPAARRELRRRAAAKKYVLESKKGDFQWYLQRTVIAYRFKDRTLLIMEM